MRKYLSMGLVIAFLQFILPISVLTQPTPPAITKAIGQDQGFTFGVIISPQGKSGEESLQFQVPPNTRILIVSLINIKDHTKEVENVIITATQPNGNVIGKESDEKQAEAKAGLKPFPQSPRLEKMFQERRDRMQKKVRKNQPYPLPMSPGEFSSSPLQEDNELMTEIDVYMKNIENQNMLGNVFFPKKRAQNQGFSCLYIHNPLPGSWTVNVKALGGPTPFQASVVAVPKTKPKTQVKMANVREVITKVEKKIEQDYPLYSPWGCSGCCECKNYVKAICSASFLINFAILVATGGGAAYIQAYGMIFEVFWTLYWVYGFYMGIAKLALTLIDWACGTDTYSVLSKGPQKICQLIGRC